MKKPLRPKPSSFQCTVRYRLPVSYAPDRAGALRGRSRLCAACHAALYRNFTRRRWSDQWAGAGRGSSHLSHSHVALGRSNRVQALLGGGAFASTQRTTASRLNFLA